MSSWLIAGVAGLFVGVLAGAGAIGVFAGVHVLRLEEKLRAAHRTISVLGED